MFQMVSKLSRLKFVLKKLRDRFTDIENKAVEAMDLLLNFQARIEQSPSIELFEEEMQLAKQCEQRLKAKHQYLHQKCKMKWLQEGDQNTSLFQKYLKARRNKNRILDVKNTQGEVKTDIEQISRALLNITPSYLAQNEWEATS
ncbi:hypothetical protein FXO38_01643 [Capsicum annuum]|nr:hypothetical protein FXO38_01643 [Capsicum annuum]